MLFLLFDTYFENLQVWGSNLQVFLDLFSKPPDLHLTGVGRCEIEIWFIVVCTLIDNEYASLLFSQTFFRIVSAWRESFQKFLKGKSDAYKQLICIMQLVHFQVRVGVSIVNKSWRRILWYCGKKQIECGLAWHGWNSTEIPMFNQSECRNCCLYNHATSEIWKYFQIWFFNRFGGKNGGVLSMHMQVILDSRFAHPGSAAIGGRKKGEFRDWTTFCLVWSSEYLTYHMWMDCEGTSFCNSNCYKHYITQ